MTTGLLVADDLASVPTERLEAEATTLAGQIAAATARFLEVVSELERRGAWESWEARSMAHWVSWKCGLGIRAAHEHVRVAVALRDLPETRAAFGRGELSYSKVRALSRFTTPAEERRDVDLALNATAYQLERIAGAYTRAARAVDPDPVRAALDGSYVSRSANDDGVTTTITLSVPNDVAARTFDAIDAATESLPDTPGVDHRARRVLGFAAVIDAFCEPDQDRPTVETVVHVDVETISAEIPGRSELAGTRIASETARRLACDGGIRLVTERAGQILDVGRRARFPNPALRRAVLQRDQGSCRFPGCTQRTRLRVHHVRHWARGGPTDRHNLIVLCPTHHRSVHEGGWTVTADGRGGFTFADPGGRLVPEVVLAQPAAADAIVAGNTARGVTVTDRTIISLADGERMDLDWVMAVVCGNHGLDVARRERSAEHSDDEWTVEPYTEPDDDLDDEPYALPPRSADEPVPRDSGDAYARPT